MKRLYISWNEGINDSTGFLHSFIKSVAMAVKMSPYSKLLKDIVATSGFAFRMWLDEERLSPSAMSSWNFDFQKSWVENSGIQCFYVGRYEDQEEEEAEKRNEAILAIKSSIDHGIPAVCWDVCGAEWGLITGYNEEERRLYILSITGYEEDLGYELLGKCDIPILSVLTITGSNNREPELILKGTLKMAIAHLKGEESGKSISGLAVYPELLRFLEEDFDSGLIWNIEYYLGTYAALKEYAYTYFADKNLPELTTLYKEISDGWRKAFDISRSTDIQEENIRHQLRELLDKAYVSEKQALIRMEQLI